MTTAIHITNNAGGVAYIKPHPLVCVDNPSYTRQGVKERVWPVIREGVTLNYHYRRVWFNHYSCNALLDGWKPHPLLTSLECVVHTLQERVWSTHYRRGCGPHITGEGAVHTLQERVRSTHYRRGCGPHITGEDTLQERVRSTHYRRGCGPHITGEGEVHTLQERVRSTHYRRGCGPHITGEGVVHTLQERVWFTHYRGFADWLKLKLWYQKSTMIKIIL